jgi:hypothetical protein
MTVGWRAQGEKMGTIDLRHGASDQLVIHYGGRLNSVDAYTFANSLVSLADTIRAINKTVNPSLNIEVRVESLGPGSFRAVIKSLQSGLAGLLKRQTETTVISILIGLIFMHWGNDRAQIIINDDSYVIQIGDDRIVLPREVYEQTKNVERNVAVQEGIQKTFSVLDSDTAIENFGFAEKIDSAGPFIQIPREDFRALSERQDSLLDPETQRAKSDRARLVVNRLWLRDVDRKWSFEWNGTPISASIKDANFRSRMKSRLVSILPGDALDVEISFVQTFDQKLGVYVNDHLSYAIERVYGKIDQDSGQEELF